MNRVPRGPGLCPAQEFLERRFPDQARHFQWGAWYILGRGMGPVLFAGLCGFAVFVWFGGLKLGRDLYDVVHLLQNY